jgi:hypothetical protein
MNVSKSDTGIVATALLGSGTGGDDPGSTTFVKVGRFEIKRREAAPRLYIQEFD